MVTEGMNGCRESFVLVIAITFDLDTDVTL